MGACVGEEIEPIVRDAQEAKVARSYGEGGAGARDARTGAVIARYRDAIRGKLDPFLEAWRAAGLTARE